MSSMMPDLAGKKLELLNEVVPKLSRVAFLAHGVDPADKLFLKETQQASERFGMKFQPLVIAAPEDIEGAFSAITRARAGALIVQPLFINNLGQGGKIADLAVRNRLPTAYFVFDFLWLNDKDLRELPLLEREKLLRLIFPRKSSWIAYVSFAHSQARKLFALVKNK